MKTIDAYIEEADELARAKQVSASVALMNSVTSIHHDVCNVMAGSEDEESREMAKTVFKQLHNTTEPEV